MGAFFVILWTNEGFFQYVSSLDHGRKMSEESEFSLKELEILDFWEKENIFQKSLDKNKERRFTFYDGPPFATGLPHYGHLLAGTIKDVIPRYKTMKGFHVVRRFGWDCHGLPIENEIEKKLDLSGAYAIKKFGIAEFNKECRSIVQRYAKEWKKTVTRMGRWVDFSKTWKTMDLSFMESVWWVFKTIYEKGLIYEGFKVMPFSAKLGTPLSNFEAGENYKDVDDPSVVVKFRLDSEELSLLAWTTTPWTLISNLAVTVNETVEYAVVKKEDERFIVAKEAVKRWFGDAEIEKTFLGKELVGKTYRPLFPYFQDLKSQGAFRVISDDFVTVENGTGIVHTAPAFGESDFLACQKAKIPLVCPVDQNGCFTNQVPEYQNQFVKDADKSIMRKLKERKDLFYQGTIRHRYPFCWRSDTPLIYRAMTTWFLNVEAIKEKLLKANRSIHWMPLHLKEGRFGKWLEGARDWAISRNRYFGTPIPIWRSEEGDLLVIGSIKELEKKSGIKISDLHREYIDSIEIIHEGKKYHRIEEVFDCWFDAGSMPYAQNHYPFENKKETEDNFPADFIAEGVDQTRGWFYTLTVLAVSLFDQPAFKNVIANGILLAEDGYKMSKRLKNYPEPELVMQKYGADAVRLYMLHSPAVKAEDLRFSEKGVELVLKQILIPLLNVLSFFKTYQTIYQWKPQKLEKPDSTLDRWILSQLHKLILDVEKGMDRYDLSDAVEPFVGYIEQLTNWYIRRSRRRFWSEKASKDRNDAFSTLYHLLIELCKVCAPFIPFITESIYLQLKEETDPQSVHLCAYPTYLSSLRDEVLEEGMDMIQLIVSLGHFLRKEQKIKVRQPLSRLDVVCQNKKVLHFLSEEKSLIQEELNVKDVVFHTKNEGLVSLAIKPNFRILGKKVGKGMKEAQLKISQFSQEEIEKLHQGKSMELQLHNGAFSLTTEDVEISHQVSGDKVAISMGAVAIALETTLTEELILEGIARELINKINTMRKEAKFLVTDRVKVSFSATGKVMQSLKKHGNYIKEEVLATEMVYKNVPNAKKWDINGEPTAIFIEKVSV